MRISWKVLSWVVASLALAGAVRAQAPAGPLPNKIYTNRPAFKLPLRIDAEERARLREVQLYMKNGAAGVWALKEAGAPTQTEFTCRVPADGEYWFTVVTVDKNGKQNPEDVSKETPGVIVVVDTQAPEIDLEALPVTGGDPVVQCVVQDVNLDPAKTKVECQTAMSLWQPLEAVPGQSNVYKLPAGSSFAGVVRAVASDRAKNTATKELKMAPVAATPPATMANIPTAAFLPPADMPLEKVTVEKVTATMVKQPSVAAMQLLNGVHASLAYQVEQKKNGGHEKVEVWLTCDDGQSWQRLAEDSDRESPIEFDLPGEGVYGLTVTVNTGNSSVPPPKGESPAFTVEVDVTKPVAQLMAIRPLPESPGIYLITWSASDKNLKPEPIDLYYAASREGPWNSIAKSLKNDGSYRWQLPSGQASEYFVRMEVSDRAGNVTRCDALQPVVSDLARPKAKVLGISVAPRLAMPAGN